MADILDTDKEAQEQKRKDEQEHERKKELQDIKDILSLPGGRRFYHRLISHCKTFHESFVVGMPDVTANNEGRRMVGNWLMTEMMDANPEAYFQMMREYRSMVTVKEIERKNQEEN